MEELTPDPTSLINGLRYIDQEASLKRFDQASDVSVFRYLWTNCWHTPTFKGKPVNMGQVLESYVQVKSIAAATMLSEPTVKRSLARLAEGGWISKEQTRYVSDTGPGWKHTNEIFVLMTPADHKARANKRDVSRQFETLLADSDRVNTILDRSW